MISAIASFSGASLTAIFLMAASFILGAAFVLLSLVLMERVRTGLNPETDE